MKCPHFGYYDRDDRPYPEVFSEWNDFCQGCVFYETCIEVEKKKEKYDNCGNCKGDCHKEGNTNVSSTGDNYPSYNNIHLKLLLHKERSKMVKKLLNKDETKITKDDIVDWIIDVEIYNKNCRKEKIKRIYKKRII